MIMTLSIKAEKTYHGFQIVCSKCGTKLSQVFPKVVLDECIYRCNECNEEMTSEQYWRHYKYYKEKFEKENVDYVVKTITDFINNYVFPIERFVETMGREHRTLQQSFTGLCLAWFTHLAGLKTGEYDLRNEASVELAKEILKKVEAANYKLPMV